MRARAIGAGGLARHEAIAMPEFRAFTPSARWNHLCLASFISTMTTLTMFAMLLGGGVLGWLAQQVID